MRSEFLNADALVDRFGRWPSLHDCEIHAVRLDSGQRLGTQASIELQIHVFEVDGVGEGGAVNYAKHTLVTLAFAGVEDVALNDFGEQNVLFDLELEDLRAECEERAHIHVALVPSCGLGGSFRCQRATVLSVEPFTPGENSVYGPNAA